MRLAPLLVLLLAAPALAAPTKVLFDNTKAETAGNADWIIDTDQPLPLPDQSTVTPATPRTYWLGAISSWGIDLVKRGYQVATLTTTYGITFGNAANPYDLSKYDVFVVDEPNTKFTSAESTAVYQYVANGGGLIAISDHDVSDRNGDGWDSPHIWNALGIQANWGIHCAVAPDPTSLANFSQDSGNVTTDSTDAVIFGPDGIADSLSFHNGTSFTIDGLANPYIRGLVWKIGVAHTSATQVMAARLQYGQGRIVFVGDSSPVDDGSAQPGNSSIFDGWGEVSGRDSLLMLNATRWVTRIHDTGPPSVTVVSPNGGEVWAPGSTHTIRWNATDDTAVDSIGVFYAANGPGLPWTRVAIPLPNTGTYGWTVPTTPTSSGYIIVAAYDRAFHASSDTSDAAFTIGSTTAVGETPPGFALDRVVPNPGRAVQEIGFRMPGPGGARLQLVDVAGRVVWSREWSALGAGVHRVAWDGRDLTGRPLAAGLYFVRLATPFGIRTQRLARSR